MTQRHRLYLDDADEEERPTPAGWVRVYTVDETIERLESGQVVEISLDFDLHRSCDGTGLDVLRWIDRRIATDPDWPVPVAIHVQSDNVTGRRQMIAAPDEIRERLRAAGRRGIPRVW